MATYVIGDVQGCYDSLTHLLRHIAFAPGIDRLWFVGDLVHRGPKSRQVLQFVHELRAHVTVVLGNHDLRLLAVARGHTTGRPEDLATDIVGDADMANALSWLQQCPLTYGENKTLLVHAGLLPTWTALDAQALGAEVETALRGPEADDYLGAYCQKQALQWSANLEGMARLCAITRVLTYLRVCDSEGCALWEFTDAPERAPAPFMPWFSQPSRRSQDTTIVCGHWAALGLHLCDNVRALDSGCVWGGKLTAWRLEDEAVFSVPAQEPAPIPGD